MAKHFLRPAVTAQPDQHDHFWYFSFVIIVYIREKGKEIQQNESMERDNVFYFFKFFIY